MMKIKYEGSTSNGQYHGYGKIFNGDYLYYEGNFENSLFNGKGIIYYQNKVKY